MELHKKWTSEGRPRGEQYESFRLYKDAKRLFRKEQRKMVRKTEENDFKELSEASEIDHIKFWKYVNRRRKKKISTNVLTTNDGRTISNPEEIADVWANYYEKRLTPEENTNFDDDFREYIDIEVSDITKNSLAGEDCASEECVHRRVFIIRLTRWIWIWLEFYKSIACASIWTIFCSLEFFPANLNGRKQ